ncbi:MAG: hypothetical protein ACP5OR_00945 [Candidatus Dormibacteria bacterium]
MNCVTVLCQLVLYDQQLLLKTTSPSQSGDRFAAADPHQSQSPYSEVIKALELRGRSTTMIVNQHLSSREIRDAFPRGLPDPTVRDSIASAILHDYHFGSAQTLAMPESMRPVLESVHSTVAPRVSTYYSKVESALAAQLPSAKQTQGARVRANVNLIE